MKQWLKQLPSICRRLLLPLICFLLLILILKQLSLYERVIALYDACLPIFSGLVIAFLLQPIIDRARKHFSLKSAVMLVYAGIIVAGSLLIVVLLPILYQQLIDFAKILPTWLTKIEDFLSTHHIVSENLSSYKQQFMEEGYSIVISSLQSFFASATQYGIAFITAFFISIDFDFWKHTAKKLLHQYPRYVTFYKTMSNIVFQYLVGTMIDLVFLAVTCGVILYAADFPNAILYAVILALSNLFPYIGPTIGLLVVIFVGVLSYDQLPIITFALIWIIQQIESNFVQPMIFNKTMDVRPILTFVALFVCEALFGIPGVLLSPIFASILQIGIRSYLHAKCSDQIGEWEDIWYDFDEVMDSIPAQE